MRMCFFNVTATYLQGGLETYCWEAGRAMARRGHEVTIVAGNRGKARHDEVRLVQFPFRAEKEWINFGVRFRRLAERMSFAQHALGHLCESGYQAVIVNKPFDFPILWKARKQGLTATTLFRSGGTDFFPGDRWFAGAISRWASASTFNARQIAARYGRTVSTIHNGVDTQVFHKRPRDEQLRSQFGANDGDVLVVSVGRLVGWKGIHVLIDALTGLPEAVRLLVVGEGPERQSLSERALAMGVAGRVRFAGALSHDALPALLSCCDVMAQPSIGEEAFGISVVEAMACGLPVLASNNGGLPEIVAPEETGQLLKPGDVGEWREALLRVAMHRELLAEWGRKSRLRAMDHFTWSANAAKLEALLCEGTA